jgi:hypothetical protein
VFNYVLFLGLYSFGRVSAEQAEVRGDPCSEPYFRLLLLHVIDYKVQKIVCDA